MICRMMVTVITLLVTISTTAYAQPMTMEDIAKVQYVRTQSLPNGVAFRSVLNGLWHDINRGETDYAVKEIQENLKLDTDEAATLLNQLISTREALYAEMNMAVAAHSCTEGEAYDLLEQIYDIEEEVSDRYYSQTRSQLDNVTAGLLDTWLSKRKSGIVYVRVDHRKADELKGSNSALVLTQLCQGANQ